MTPTMMPTSAQAMPTPSAWRAPSDRALMHMLMVARAPAASRLARISAPTTMNRPVMPLNSNSAAEATAITTQKAARSGKAPKRPTFEAPRMKITVSASPTVPAKSGV